MGKGPYKATNPNQTPNAVNLFSGSQVARDKLRCQKGNNPDYQLRSPSAG
jgi:hypothetical protein